MVGGVGNLQPGALAVYFMGVGKEGVYALKKSGNLLGQEKHGRGHREPAEDQKTRPTGTG